MTDVEFSTFICNLDFCKINLMINVAAFFYLYPIY